MSALRRIVVGLVLVFGMQGASVAQAQVAIGPTFDLRFENYSLWSRLGTASYQGSLIPDYVAHTLILTGPQQADSAGAAFSPYETTINLNEPFTVSFYFFMAPGQVLSGEADAPAAGLDQAVDVAQHAKPLHSDLDVAEPLHCLAARRVEAARSDHHVVLVHRDRVRCPV